MKVMQINRICSSKPFVIQIRKIVFERNRFYARVLFKKPYGESNAVIINIIHMTKT